MGAAPLIFFPMPTSAHSWDQLVCDMLLCPPTPCHTLRFLPGMDWIIRWTLGAQLCLGELGTYQSDPKGRGHQEENGLKSVLGASDSAPDSTNNVSFWA